MRIVVSGASGLVGSALVPWLEAADHEVIRLVRTSVAANAGEAVWNPARGEIDGSVIEGADAVINLNGRSIAEGRWSAKVKEELRSSRIDSTTTLATAIGSSSNPPRLLINASAVGYYGDRGDETLDEASVIGEGFLAELSRDWEAAALAAASERTRVVLLRLGIVIASGGALGRMLTPFKLGLGGPVGSGRQFWPWIAIGDVCGIVGHVLHNDGISGPVNAVSSEEVRSSEFARTLGRVLSRPAFMPMPAFAAKLALGEMADSLLLASQRVRPGVLEGHGYTFKSPTLDQAIRTVIQ
jgi:uncharacterized protein (TIGR01777 family)